MAAVIDEWGSFEGLVTVEDAVESVVGDLQDSFDVEEREPAIHRHGEAVDVDGGVAIGTVNDALELSIDGEGVETIGGVVLSRLGRVPELGDSVDIEGRTVEVTSVDGARISRLRIHDSAAESTAERTDGEE